MIKFRLKIAAVLLTFLVLYSTTSYSFSVHRCNNIVYTISFVNDISLGCEMEMTSCKHPSYSNSKLSYYEKTCCSDQKIIKNSTTIKLHKKIKLQINKIYNPSLFFYTLNYFKPLLKNNFDYYKQYSPPLLTIKTTTLYQVFRL